MPSKRPKKQFESSSILELGYRAACGREGNWVCPRTLCARALRCNTAGPFQICFLRACVAIPTPTTTPLPAHCELIPSRLLNERLFSFCIIFRPTKHRYVIFGTSFKEYLCACAVLEELLAMCLWKWVLLYMLLVASSVAKKQKLEIITEVRRVGYISLYVPYPVIVDVCRVPKEI